MVLFVRGERDEALRKPILPRFRSLGYAALNRCIVERIAPVFDERTDLIVVSDGACVPGAVATIAQRGATFGERIAHAITDTLALGYHAVVVVGNDCPTLTSADVAAGFDLLEAHARTVAAEARDGGAFLVGARHDTFADAADLECFIALPWQTPHLFAAMMRLAGAAALRVVRADFDRWLGRSAERALDLLFHITSTSAAAAILASPVYSAVRHKAITRVFLTSPPAR